MKIRNLIYGSFLLFIPFWMASCLDDGGNSITLASQVGVVKEVTEEGALKKYLVLNQGDRIYSPDFEKNDEYRNGDCGLADFVIDYSAAENINNRENGIGVYKAETLTFTKIKKDTLKTELSDTLKVRPGEVFVTSIYEKSVILEKNLFLFTDHAVSFEKKGFDLSFNKEAEPVVINEKSAYNFYLRYTSDTTRANEREIKYSAIDLAPFIAEKKAKAEKDSLFFRIYYVSAMGTDSVPLFKASREFAVSVKE